MSNLKVFKHISDAQKWNGVGNINNAIDSLIEAVIELSKGSASAATAPAVMMGAPLDETHEPSVWPTVQTDSAEVQALKREFEALGQEHRKVFSVEVGDLSAEQVKEVFKAVGEEAAREVSIPTPVTADPPKDEEPVAKPAPKKPTKGK